MANRRYRSPLSPLAGARAIDKVQDRPVDRYDIYTEVLFAQDQLIDVAALAAAQTPWWNRTLSEVNDAVMRLAVMEGDFHWHKHDLEDEFFYVVEGRLNIELEDCTGSIALGLGVTVPRGVMHLRQARCRTMVLMVDKAGVVPLGN